MLNNLTDNFTEILKKLKGHGKLTEQNIRDAMREIRRALLEADVNFRIVKEFINSVSEEAIGVRVMKSLTPG
ncbi:MAG: signal recognition particle receptor subunit alpha, partial [Candidatus Cloacimonetes bacterium]|nr:signal recognition particle receptor subunit alpha [Candidatus Cloacimonadota bacterium]